MKYKYVLCDRCGERIAELDNKSEVTVNANYNIHVIHRTSVDLCEKCTEQFYTHFMKNHWKAAEEEK